MQWMRESGVLRTIGGTVATLALVAVTACAPRAEPQAGPVAMPDGSIDGRGGIGDTVTQPRGLPGGEVTPTGDPGGQASPVPFLF